MHSGRRQKLEERSKSNTRQLPRQVYAQIHHNRYSRLLVRSSPRRCASVPLGIATIPPLERGRLVGRPSRQHPQLAKLVPERLRAVPEE
jgi:hypothetical protein